MLTPRREIQGGSDGKFIIKLTIKRKYDINYRKIHKIQN